MCGLYDSNNIFSKLNVMLDRPNKMENRRKEKETVSEKKETKNEETTGGKKEDTKKENKTVDEKAEIEKEKKTVDGNSKTEKETVDGNGKNKKEKKKEKDTVDVKRVVMKKIWTYVTADWQGFTQVALFNNSPHFSLLQIVLM